MDFNATIDLIIKDLRDAGDIIDDLKKYPGVPVLQVELAKSKCRSAGEVIAMLKTLRETVPEKVREEPVIPEIEPVDEVKEPVILEIETVEEDNEPVIPEIKPVEEIKEPVIPEIKPVTEVKEYRTEKVQKKEQESVILADRFSHLSGTFNEQLGTRKGDDDIADILKTKHVTSLPEAIGVNDKFLFIREIFNGNQNDYTQAISRLESSENLTDARAVIMSYTGENSESEAVKQLLDLVKRKLPSNE